MKVFLFGAMIVLAIGCSQHASRAPVPETSPPAASVQSVTDESAIDFPGQTNTEDDVANEIANADELDDDATTLMRMMLEQEHGGTISSETFD